MRQLFFITIIITAIITSANFGCKPKPTETPPLETKISGRVTDKTATTKKNCWNFC